VISNKISRMRQQERRLYAAYLEKVERLRAENKTETDIDMIMGDERNTLSQLEVDIVYAESDALIAKAAKLKVPSPPKNDEESWNTFYGVPYLTHAGYAKLRSRIRQEKKERREAITAIIKDIISPLGALIISILSLLIAYAALKFKH
jgi:hypothetical protein